ncbi:phosphonate C-P lyase system protein PhnG [Tabrizicola sp.]|uniref:phosphonate C-P lyase system protein PhnG n=1 Tax=Tabrizicola sp. TaxID=2005166 RepID=UPI00260C07DE|nr:phosphonate C-P lyase system protein PhnG [Tabrizicola sp.]MDM7933418.1 phosphonate C-P lyase system protein PhnG [Tabrizicola sp.]
MTDASPIARKDWMAVLAKAAPARLAALMPDLPPHTTLRNPETGAVMVRGRVSATGAPFNLGEMTVTRCSVRLEDGAVGHAWVQGRDKAHARRAAIVDALMQTGAAAAMRAHIIAPLAGEAAAARSQRAERAAATKVDFFTMVRGEDQ